MGIQFNKMHVGDTWNFPVSGGESYPAPTWDLTLYLAPRFTTPAQSLITLNSTDEGSGHRVAVAAGVTATYKPGKYQFWTRASDGSQKFTLDGTEWSGEVSILPDPATLTQGTDGRTQAQKALDDAKAALAAWSPMTKSYSIAGRSMFFNSPSEIIQIINHWESEVTKERDAAALAAGLKNSRIIYQRYGNA
jgi:hypothetical protein